jgi:hypothetical protein
MCLLEELKDAQLAPLVLPNLFMIIEKLDSQTIVEKALPAIRNLLTLKDPACTHVLLDHFGTLTQKLSPDTFQTRTFFS